MYTILIIVSGVFIGELEGGEYSKRIFRNTVHITIVA